MYQIFFFVQGIHKNTLFRVVHTKKYIKLEARRDNKLALEKIENWTKFAIRALALIKRGRF